MKHFISVRKLEIASDHSRTWVAFFADADLECDQSVRESCHNSLDLIITQAGFLEISNDETGVTAESSIGNEDHPFWKLLS